MSSRFSRPVSSSWIAADCPARPMSGEPRGLATTSCPRPGPARRPGAAGWSGRGPRWSCPRRSARAPPAPCRGNGQVDPAQRVHVAERLGQPLHQNGGPGVICVTTLSSRADHLVGVARRPRTYRQRGPDREPITRPRRAFGGYDDHGHANSSGPGREPGRATLAWSQINPRVRRNRGSGPGLAEIAGEGRRAAEVSSPSPGQHLHTGRMVSLRHAESVVIARPADALTT